MSIRPLMSKDEILHGQLSLFFPSPNPKIWTICSNGANSEGARYSFPFLGSSEGQLATSSEGQRDSRLALPAQRGSWATRQAAPTPTTKSPHSFSWMDLGSWGHS